jgi:hypothetical protein
VAVNYRRGIKRVFAVYFVAVCLVSAWVAMERAVASRQRIFSWCMDEGRTFAACSAEVADLADGFRFNAWIEAGVWIVLWGLVLPLVAYGLFRLVRWLVAGFKPQA